VCLRSPPGRESRAEFPELAEIAEQLTTAGVILDGELVCFAADGAPDFAGVRTRLLWRGARAAVLAQRNPATLVVFDVLQFDGRAVRELLYARRRELLAELALDGPT
jgi:bifunctional non-homologous end joining protein LigD